MEQIISLATGAVCRPWSPIKLPKQLKTSGLVEIIKKNIRRGKTRKDYVLVYEYLYILAKHAYKSKIAKEFSQHQQTLATKIHVLAKGNKWIMPYLNNVPLIKCHSRDSGKKRTAHESSRRSSNVCWGKFEGCKSAR